MMSLKKKKEQIIENFNKDIEFHKTSTFNGGKDIKNMLDLSLLIIEKLDKKIDGIMPGPTYKINKNLVVEAVTRLLNTRIILKSGNLNNLNNKDYDKLLESVSDKIVKEFTDELDRLGSPKNFWAHYLVDTTGPIIDPRTGDTVYGLLTRYAMHN